MIARAHLWIAAVLAAITICTGLIWSARVAAGADAYGSVSQVDPLVNARLYGHSRARVSGPLPPHGAAPENLGRLEP